MSGNAVTSDIWEECNMSNSVDFSSPSFLLDSWQRLVSACRLLKPKKNNCNRINPENSIWKHCLSFICLLLHPSFLFFFICKPLTRLHTHSTSSGIEADAHPGRWHMRHVFWFQHDSFPLSSGFSKPGPLLLLCGPGCPALLSVFLLGARRRLQTVSRRQLWLLQAASYRRCLLSGDVLAGGRVAARGWASMQTSCQTTRTWQTAKFVSCCSVVLPARVSINRFCGLAGPEACCTTRNLWTHDPIISHHLHLRTHYNLPCIYNQLWKWRREVQIFDKINKH